MNNSYYSQSVDIQVKEYKLNKDYSIICKTIDYKNGHKKYNIIVSLISVPFLCYLEEFEVMDDPQRANNIFKQMRNKYN